tara:strand:+ start:3520 stop:3966 length:447 start_codon:yes stop_codon:yes gene_type:complete
MEIKFNKTHPDAKLPFTKHPNELEGDSGRDLYSVNEEDIYIFPGNSVVVPVGLEVAYISPGYWFKIEGRSGLGFKHGIQPHAGIIDNMYRGDLGIKLYNLGSDMYTVTKGERIAQLVVYPLIAPTMSIVDEKSSTERGSQGFGSTGKN